MAKAVGLPQNSYCLFAKVRASLPDSTARQVELAAVDGEDAVAPPERPGPVGAAQDLGVELPEDLGVNPRPGLAHGRVGDRLRLRQGHVQGAALGPQLGQRRGVALAARSEHEAEHEQHHQQRVEDAAAHLPELVVRGGDGAERAEQALPECDEVRVGGLRLRRRRRRGPGSGRDGSSWRRGSRCPGSAAFRRRFRAAPAACHSAAASPPAAAGLPAPARDSPGSEPAPKETARSEAGRPRGRGASCTARQASRPTHRGKPASGSPG